MPLTDATYRVTFETVLSGSKFLKWKTVFWSLAANLATIQARADKMKKLLNDFLGGQALVRSYGIKIMATPRLVENKFENSQTVSAVDDDTDTDYPTTAMLVELRADGSYKTNIWLSGLRDKDVKNVARLQVDDNDFKKRWTPIVTELTTAANAWAIRKQDPSKADVAIKSFDMTTGIITTYGAHGLADGTLKSFRIRGVENPAVLNGAHKLLSSSSTTLTVDGWSALTGQSFSKKKQCFLREVGYVAMPIVEVKALRSTSHDRGRPT